MFYIVCHLLLLWSGPAEGFASRHIIHVNNTTPTSSNNSCSHVNGNPQELTCPTLNKALQVLKSSTVIYIYPGKQYSLEPGNETTIINQSDISIIGYTTTKKQDDIVLIDCHNKTGLAILHSNNIVFKSVSFSNCSQIQTSSSRDFYSSTFRYLPYHVAIYIKFCINVTFSKVTVQNTDGVGVTMYNTVGNVTIVNSEFIRNDKSGHVTPGGGGLQVELSDTLFSGINDPTLFESDLKYYSTAHYFISNTTFRENKAHFRQHFAIFTSGVYYSTKMDNTFNLGKGGGFQIIVRGKAANNTFIIGDNTVVNDNDAHSGGGFYISFQDSAADNLVSFNDSRINNNQNFDVDLNSIGNVFDIDGGGGGGKVLYDSSHSTTKMSNNIFRINNCSFHHNQGITGGALWVEAVLGLDSDNNQVIIENTQSFFLNSAFLGSAMYFSGQFSNSDRKVHTVLKNVNCSYNRPLCDRVGSAQHSAFLPCTGIIYSINFPLTLQGIILFEQNTATAIEIHEGNLDITNDTELIFIENTSQYGGALALYDCSYMTIHPNTNLTFVNNSVKVSGGAIYSGSCSGSGEPVSSSFRCFVQYSEESVHPEKWITTLLFNNNTMATRDNDSLTVNDMYVTSLPACWWPKYGSNIITKSDYNETFCWSPWKFSDSCYNSYQSSPAYVNYSQHDNEQIKLYPGQSVPMPDVYDGRLNKIPVNNIVACVLYGPGSFSHSKLKSCVQSESNTDNIFLFLYLQSGNATTNESKHVLISVHLDNKFSYGPSFYVHLKACQWPFKYSLSKSYCIYERHDFLCEEDNIHPCGVGSNVHPKHQYCVTNTTDIGLAIGLCPPAYNKQPMINWSKNTISSADSCLYNKSGLLCGGCVESYGVPLNSLHYECYDCSQSIIPGPILFLLLQILPLTIFVFFIFIFGIQLTSGVSSGFIFYWQIITLNFPAWFYPAWFTFAEAPDHDKLLNSDVSRFATSLYSITNLNFLVAYSPGHLFPICITNNMGSLGAIVFWYVVPIYTLVLMGVVMLWLLIYDRGVYCVILITRPVHKCLARFWSRFNIKTSLVSSVSSIYVLCFTEIAAISFKLLHYSSWQSLQEESVRGKVFFYDGNVKYFGVPHIYFALLAIILLLTVILIPMLFVLLFPSRLFHRFVLDKIKWKKLKNALISLGDTFTGCYKDNSDGRSLDFRYFAGIFLLLRLVIMSFYYIPGQQSKLILYFETGTMVIIAGMVMIFRPYKKMIDNFTNFCLLILLALLTTFCLFFKKKGVITNLVFTMHIPSLLAIVFIAKWLKARRISCCNNRIIYFNEASTDADDNDYLPDRLQRPDMYSEVSDEEEDSSRYLISTSQRSSTIQRGSRSDGVVPLRSTVSGYGTM